MTNTKLILAPFLAVTLTILIAAAINFSSIPSSNSQLEPSASVSSIQTYPTPTPAPMEMAVGNSDMLSIVSIIAAICVSVISALLFFREKQLKEDIKP